MDAVTRWSGGEPRLAVANTQNLNGFHSRSRRICMGRECAHSHAGGVCFDREERHAAMRAADIDGIGHAPQPIMGLAPCQPPREILPQRVISA
jgi:hypothetical protein